MSGERLLTDPFPADISTYRTDSTEDILDVLKHSGLSASRNEARRLIRQGAVTFYKKKYKSSLWSGIGPALVLWPLFLFMCWWGAITKIDYLTHRRD